MTAADIDAAIERWDESHVPGPGVKCIACKELGDALFYSEKFKSNVEEWVRVMVSSRTPEDTGRALLMALKWAVAIGIEAGKGETECLSQNATNLLN